jgi:uncharacterized protein YndB with AHSA1/START domain
MRTTRVSQQVRASRARVYQALLDPRAVERWMVPNGMTSEVHSFDPSEGGTFRISLTYDDPSATGKTTASTDTFEGRFVTLDKDRRVVQVVEFDTANADIAGKMTITYLLTDTADGCEVTGIHENLPDSISPADNELGWAMSLVKLATLVESAHPNRAATDGQ